MAAKRYIGKITKGKYKGRSGFVSQRDYIKQNKEKILSGELFPTASELKVFKQLEKNEKISIKAKGRLRYKGKFLNKFAENRIRKFLKKVPLTQENINNAYEKALFFTFRSNEVADMINNHKGLVLLNGEAFQKAEAITEFDILNQENFREWADELEIDTAAIYFIVYDATYTPETKELDIDTMVNDADRVITSDPEIKAARAAERKRKKENK